MKALDSLLRGFDALVKVMAGVSLLVITVVLFINAVARYFADFVVIGGEELSRYLMVWVTFLGSYLLVRVQRHITVDIFSRVISKGALRIVNMLCATVGAITLGYIAWLGWELASFIWETGQMSSSLPIRRAWIYMAIPVGCGLMAIAYVFELLVAIFGGTLPRAGDYGLPDDLATAESIDVNAKPVISNF
ncbi:TRAP transporter small permease [Pusillimonas sp. CC-YST705]|uniref:TRAP transporter small permease protein n=1 Tax=Mesopusillimonas faecipullorum TaxID=2755040 RepID=A0ABS8C8Q4_9BURK|nr:TRAP transporter small permease [Mesopusillimonas faecipullorum]MCB5362401.1 TRAP transporter small permease [Mesopusillimonas faecipullorum]